MRLDVHHFKKYRFKLYFSSSTIHWNYLVEIWSIFLISTFELNSILIAFSEEKGKKGHHDKEDHEVKCRSVVVNIIFKAMEKWNQIQFNYKYILNAGLFFYFVFYGFIGWIWWKERS